MSPMVANSSIALSFSAAYVETTNCCRYDLVVGTTAKFSLFMTTYVYAAWRRSSMIIAGKKPSVTNLRQYLMEKRQREGSKGVPDSRMPGVEENDSASGMIMIAEKNRERNKGGEDRTKNPEKH
uniref:Uncharacterized protein n=1 Tax=Lactuca sativa TaxID=4236 RepID=A0A9R1XE94_LACSA|nr:hypothetical protein LSAT_V11C500234320 [Lactuca sativa]